MTRIALPVSGLPCLFTFMLSFLYWGTLAGSTPALADSAWTDVHPMRREAFTEGRLFTYNAESFLHRFSYRNLSSSPGPGDDGLWGSGGSITGDQLYLEINGQYTLRPDNERYGIIARMQRREDFDGRFDRQMVGFSRRFGSNWEGAFISDITGDKGLVDFQLEANWRPSDDRFLRLAVVQTDRLYNNKSDSGNKFSTTPTTYFAHLRQPLAGQGYFETAVNFTPTAEYTDRDAGFTTDADQLRWMSDIRVPLTSQWYGGARIEYERSQRQFSVAAVDGAVPGSDFSRDMHHVMVSLSSPSHQWSPHFGIRHFELDESGWFGSGLATDGSSYRRESGVFAGVTYRTGDTHWLEPTLFLQHVDFQREFLQRPLDDRERNELVGKVILPWRVIINREAGAVLSLNPTFRVHRFAFGGGNIQLHWPL